MTSSGVIKAFVVIREAKTMCAAAAKIDPRGVMRPIVDVSGGRALDDGAVRTDSDDPDDPDG